MINAAEVQISGSKLLVDHKICVISIENSDACRTSGQKQASLADHTKGAQP